MRLDNIKIVSFSGIDGAGKSTQIEALCRYLQDLGLTSTVFAFWDNVAALPAFRERLSCRAFKGDQGVGSPKKPLQRRDKNVAAWYITVLRVFLYTLDAFSLRVAVARNVECGADFIIFDRYLYDELANLPLRHLAARLYVRLLLRCVPRPDIALVLDAEPEAATARKPEYPLEFVRHNRDAYLRLSRMAGGITVVPPLPVEQTQEMIRGIVSERCLQVRTKALDYRLPCPMSETSAKGANG